MISSEQLPEGYKQTEVGIILMIGIALKRELQSSFLEETDLAVILNLVSVLDG